MIKYELLVGNLSIRKGTTVYACSGYDYGCARDDTEDTGEPHISVTLDSEGNYPFFTCPISSLQEIKE